MSYTIYATDAIVLSVYNTGEASRRIQLLTRDIGLVSAVVQSARQSTKLSVGAQWMSAGVYDCVYGISGWRIVGMNNIYNYAQMHIGRMEWFAKRCRYIERFVVGEQPDPVLFELVQRLYRQVIENNDTDDEYLFVLFRYHILRHMGYVPADTEPSNSKDFHNLLASIESQTHL